MSLIAYQFSSTITIATIATSRLWRWGFTIFTTPTRLRRLGNVSSVFEHSVDRRDRLSLADVLQMPIKVEMSHGFILILLGTSA